MLTDKEKMELLNLRKRVQSQREEIKKLKSNKQITIHVNDFGTLFAILPDGSCRTILVDVHDTQHYGILRIGVPIDKEEQ